MRVLVACEFSGRVRDAFRALGHDAFSCDILPSETPGPHIQCDVSQILDAGWDLIIAHPPCRYLSISGNRWKKQRGRKTKVRQALAFVRRIMRAKCPRIAIENPVSLIGSAIRKADQSVQPWQFGHGEIKRTCFWLKGLPKLKPTRIVKGRKARVHREPPGPDRWKNRSRTYKGIASAMAAQWGAL